MYLVGILQVKLTWFKMVHSIIRPVRWAELAVLAMYCSFGYLTLRLIEL